jgi:pimeloyl-ACP methyl ester carboxylesterase
MFDDRPLDLSAALTDALAGLDIEVPYTLSDMAGDVIGLLDHLEVEQAHLAGVSMGGMIAQTAAVEHPHRVRSLISIMSSTGSRSVGQPTPEAIEVLFERSPSDRDGAVDAAVRAHRIICSPDYFDEEETRIRAAAAFDRSFNPDGIGRCHTAETIPGATLMIVDDMGHDLARPLWERLIGAIAEHIHKAESASIQ